MQKQVGLVLSVLVLAVGCAAESGSSFTYGGVERADGKFDTSVEAVVLDFEFAGEFVTDNTWGGYEQLVEQQLMYTVGHLNEQNSVGRLDRVQITNLDWRQEGASVKVTYRASMPVAWGRGEAVPTSYDFKLPYDVSFDGFEAFTEKYKNDCVDWSAHDVDSGSMWYYYRPGRCTLDQADIYVARASVHVSEVNTTGKFPEYHKVWEDNAFNSLAIFGKIEEGATSNDPGITAYNTFIRIAQQKLLGAGATDVTTEPVSLPSNPGVDIPDVAIYATLPDGKRVQVNALLVDNVRTQGQAFDVRYGELSTDADLIVYSGHSGLGANIRALASKGRFKQGQYKVVFMNGCDTHAYVDSALADASAAVNPDDPNGTKYLDIATNAMPSYARASESNTTAFFEGLLNFEQPKTFEQIMAAIDPAQIVLVTGEQDNVYVPGGGGTDPEPWSRMDEAFAVAQGDSVYFETPVIEPGTFIFEIRGDGDADLYVRIGQEPDLRNYDCRPYQYGSNERCQVALPTAAPIHVMVHGYQGGSGTMTGLRLPN